MKRNEIIDEILSVYEIESVLADKGDSSAIKLRHKESGKPMVLHSFPQFYSIYELMCAIQSKYLPEIMDSVCCEDGQIVLEEFIEGKCLADCLADSLLDYRQARKVMRDLCCALILLHKNDFVHRDIKPENIIMRNDFSCVLIDFNASRRKRETKKDTQILGTVGYAAPEQMGIKQSDSRTDIYAMGILLNVLLTGLHPSSKMATGKAGKIIRKCTAVNPEDRYQSAEELWRAL